MLLKLIQDIRKELDATRTLEQRAEVAQRNNEFYAELERLSRVTPGNVLSGESPGGREPMTHAYPVKTQ